MYFLLMLVQLFRCLLVRYNHDRCPKASAASFWIPAFMLYLWQRLRACTEPHVTPARARSVCLSIGRTDNSARTAVHGATAQTIRQAN